MVGLDIARDGGEKERASVSPGTLATSKVGPSVASSTRPFSGAPVLTVQCTCP